jgi:hypothetical protein
MVKSKLLYFLYLGWFLPRKQANKKEEEGQKRGCYATWNVSLFHYLIIVDDLRELTRSVDLVELCERDREGKTEKKKLRR